jgi:tetratricopeptide (TPR) repeat protein
MFAFEDAHFMDEASRDLLTRLFQARESHRAMLVLTHQRDQRILEVPEGQDRECVFLSLNPLSSEQLEEIVDLATEESPLLPHEVEEIARRSGGNTLFLFDLIRAYQASGSLESLPDSVESSIAGQIDRLGPSDRMILRYASVLGASFDPAMLEEVVRDDVDFDEGVWNRLSALLRPEDPGKYRFRTTLVRDAAYEGLPYRRRRALHNRVGETIEANAGVSTEEELGTLALHFHEAQRWDKSWDYCKKAGDRALRIYANVEASRFYEKALTAGRHLRGVTATELARAYELESEARFRLGEFSAADHELAAARRLLKDHAAANAELAVKQARLSLRTGRYRQALVRIARALDSLEGAKGREAASARAHLLVMYAGARFFQNRRQDAIHWARKAIDVARRAGTQDALASAYRYLDAALRESGEPGKAKYSGKALEIFEQLGDLRSQAAILNDMGTTAQALSDWDSARELYNRARTMFDRSGDRPMLMVTNYNLGEILTDQGRYDEAEPLLREVIRVWRAAGADADVAETKRELGKTFARRGESAAGLELLTESLAELTGFQKDGEALSTRVRLAEAYVLAGQTAAAIAAIDESLRDANAIDGGKVFIPALERLRAWTDVQAGDPAKALSEFRRGLKDARRRGDIYETALNLDAIHRVEASRGDDAAAIGIQRDALFARLGIVTAPVFPLSAASPA